MNDNPAVRVMQRAFGADPSAVKSLLSHRVACNSALACDPNVVTGPAPTGGFDVGALGFINGVLDALGLPKVAAVWSGTEADPGDLLGFHEFDEGGG